MALLSLPPSFFLLFLPARNAAGETRKFHSPPEFIAANMDFEFRGWLKRGGEGLEKGRRDVGANKQNAGRSC